jgi:hypothetical protein
MPTFKSIKELHEFLKDKVIRGILDNEMAEMVKRVEQEAIEEVVYQVYTPQEYKRRGHSGGLIDKDYMEHSVSEDGTVLEVINDTPPNYGYGGEENVEDLPALVEFGHGSWYRGRQQFYTYPSDKRFIQPRPFTKATRDKIEQEKLHIKTMKDALESKGIKTK